MMFSSTEAFKPDLNELWHTRTCHDGFDINDETHWHKPDTGDLTHANVNKKNSIFENNNLMHKSQNNVMEECFSIPQINRL